MRKNRNLRSMLSVAFIAGTLAACAESGGSDAADRRDRVVGGDDRNGEYVPAVDWLKSAPSHNDEWGWGEISGVAAIDPDRVFVVTWGDMNVAREIRDASNPTHMLVVLNRNGEVVENWSQWDSVMHTPHHVFVDPYDPSMPVWVVERGERGGSSMQVLKFSNDGKELLLRLGDYPIPGNIRESREREPGPFRYGQPASMAFYPNGDILLADGYWNCRVVRYNREGEYLSEFGECGSGPGQFETIHGLAIDQDRRIYVADRSNNRIQVFEEDGSFVAEWPDIASPADVWVDETNAVWVVGRTTNRILKYDTEGHLLYHWGTYGGTSGGFDQGSGGFGRPHQISVDREGNFYVANWDLGTVGKHSPRPGADRSRLILPQMLLR